MKPDNGPMMRFCQADAAGRVICIVCRERDGIHSPTCPIVELDLQVRELTAHTGNFVASVRDTLETIGRILRDERRQP
jgi:hypothetical protein